ncbi:sigma-70 family RNA polymerase sigma factor [Candidatus Uhrbacteria bacterium]|nr:sigma-70 family RNA polymerase sigma factor [Candidatus Uhrbacteria bacterium]
MNMSNDRAEMFDCNALACQWQHGNQQAGALIFDYFASQIFRFFIVRLFNREIAEDLTQHVFLKVTNKIHTFDTNLGNFSSWIWQITRNTLIDYFREKKHVVFSDLPSEGEHFINESDDPAQEVKYHELLALVKTLSTEEQEIFSLHHLSDPL